MLVSTQRKIALRCPLCGKLELHPISLFDFSGYAPLRIACQCGFTKLVINTKNYKEFNFQLPCLICDEVHILKFLRHELWEMNSSILRCTETGQELGYIGTNAAIERIIQQKQQDVESIINGLGFDDYFSNPPVMFEVLNLLNQISEANLLSCSCGNRRIEIDIFPEKLELHCPYCQSIHIIYAETLEDLYLVKQAKRITLTERGFTSFDSSKVRPNLKS